MKTTLFVLCALVFVACKTTRTEEAKEEEVFMEPVVTPLKTVEAKVIYRQFINKAGKPIEGAGDYFLVYENQEWFIKFSASTVRREEIAALKDSTAIFEVSEMEGLWDTDDPTHQSRVGKFVAVYSIEKR